MRSLWLLQILSFVFEQAPLMQARASLPKNLREAIDRAQGALMAEDKRSLKSHKPLPLTMEVAETFHTEGLLRNLVISLTSAIEDNEIFRGLLWIFVAHCSALSDVPLRDRAQEVAPLNPDLLHVITEEFLPEIFCSLDALAGSSYSALDLDCRVFTHLVWTVLDQPSASLQDIIGASAATRLLRTYESCTALQPLVELTKLSANYPNVPAAAHQDRAPQPPIHTLLPFDNEFFNNALAEVNVTIEDQDEEEAPQGHLDFGSGTMFSDTKHWHNHQRSVLPGYLGGEKEKPKDEWQRRKQLRSNQRFMATLQRQAATLTGASGTSLQRIVIPQAGLRSSKQDATQKKTGAKVRSCS